jgi:hypothetical protein
MIAGFSGEAVDVPLGIATGRGWRDGAEGGRGEREAKNGETEDASGNVVKGRRGKAGRVKEDGMSA